jgi:hypothetical protein
MSTKVTLKHRDHTQGAPGFHLYEDVLDFDDEGPRLLAAGGRGGRTAGGAWKRRVCCVDPSAGTGAGAGPAIGPGGTCQRVSKKKVPAGCGDHKSFTNPAAGEMPEPSPLQYPALQPAIEQDEADHRRVQELLVAAREHECSVLA